MALDLCPKCSRYVDNTQAECPYCGQGLSAAARKKAKYSLPVLILMGGVLATTYLAAARWGLPIVPSLPVLPFGKSEVRTPLVTTSAVVNIRVQPDIGAALIGRNQPGELLTALGQVADWTRVRFRGGSIGYVHSRLLREADASGWSAQRSKLNCDKGTDSVGREYRVTGNGVNVRSGPGRMSRVLKDRAAGFGIMQLDKSMRVVEECVDGVWSRVRVVEPQRLAGTHHGWVSRRYLSGGSVASNDTMSTSALSPYSRESLSSRVPPDFSSRMEDIETLRDEAARAMLAGGLCDYIDATELSTRSRLDRLVVMVDCRNGKRFYFNEEQSTLAAYDGDQ